MEMVETYIIVENLISWREKLNILKTEIYKLELHKLKKTDDLEVRLLQINQNPKQDLV